MNLGVENEAVCGEGQPCQSHACATPVGVAAAAVAMPAQGTRVLVPEASLGASLQTCHSMGLSQGTLHCPLRDVIPAQMIITESNVSLVHRSIITH